MAVDRPSDDGWETAEQRGPERRCVVTRTVKPKDQMIRFVVGPDGTVTPDVDERLPGRGFWLSADRDVVNTACTKNVFAKVARRRVQVPPDMPDRLEALLASRCCRTIGLARRAGQLVAGFEKVKEQLRRERVGLLFEAGDGAADGRAKIKALGGETPVMTVLSGSELGAAIGREHVVHVAVDEGRFAEMLKRDAARLVGFRKPVEDRDPAPSM